ncbi:MAG: NAD-dependent epimerase/dehydratase family protein [Bacillota bacterium]
MEKKIDIAGGTGFIGRYLQKNFLELGHEVTIISRQSFHVPEDRPEDIVQSLEGAEMLINLAESQSTVSITRKIKLRSFNQKRIQRINWGMSFCSVRIHHPNGSLCTF